MASFLIALPVLALPFLCESMPCFAFPLRISAGIIPSISQRCHSVPFRCHANHVMTVLCNSVAFHRSGARFLCLALLLIATPWLFLAPLFRSYAMPRTSSAALVATAPFHCTVLLCLARPCTTLLLQCLADPGLALPLLSKSFAMLCVSWRNSAFPRLSRAVLCLFAAVLSPALPLLLYALPLPGLALPFISAANRSENTPCAAFRVRRLLLQYR